MVKQIRCRMEEIVMSENLLTKSDLSHLIHDAVESKLGDEIINIKELVDDIHQQLSEDIDLIRQLGSEALRKRIEHYLRTCNAQHKLWEYNGQGDLFNSEIQSYYPDNHGNWIRTDKLDRPLFKTVLERYQLQYEGLKAHIEELHELNEKCDSIWAKHPEYSVGDCINVLNAKNRQIEPTKFLPKSSL